MRFRWSFFVTIMASGKKHVRFTVDVALPSARTAFKNRLSSVRDLLSPPGGPKLDKLALMTALLHLAVLRSIVSGYTSESVTQTGTLHKYVKRYKDINSLLIDVGVFIGDCGLYTIAFITSIAFGLYIDPSLSAYKQNAMRNHLLTCLERINMSPFPITGQRRQSIINSAKYVGVKVYCKLEVPTMVREW